jgi:hypothetical protein
LSFAATNTLAGMADQPWIQFADLACARGLALPAGTRVRVSVAPAPAPQGRNAPADMVDSAWAEAQAQNPALFDGPILAVDSLQLGEAMELGAHIDRFARLVAQQRGAVTGVQLLGCKGLITGIDRHGGEHVLLGRRASGTRVYPGMWEIAPAGGIDPPPHAPVTLSHADLLASLAAEGQEELSLDLAERTILAEASLAVVVDDRLAQSLDLIFPLRWRGAVDPRRGLCSAQGCPTEYVDACWVARGDLPAFDQPASNGRSPITPPSRVALRLLGWLPALR